MGPKPKEEAEAKKKWEAAAAKAAEEAAAVTETHKATPSPGLCKTRRVEQTTENTTHTVPQVEAPAPKSLWVQKKQDKHIYLKDSWSTITCIQT